VTVEGIKMMYEEIKEKLEAETKPTESEEESEESEDETPEEKPEEKHDDDSESSFLCDMFALIGGLSVSVFLGAMVNSTIRYFQ